MRVMASHAIELAVALQVAFRLAEPDGLEPGQARIVATELGGTGPVRMTMALATET